jgi:hypothetical protein
VCEEEEETQRPFLMVMRSPNAGKFGYTSSIMRVSNSGLLTFLCSIFREVYCWVIHWLSC